MKLSKVNLFLHGFPDPAIHIYDTLTNDARWNDKADLILANPPFMTPKGGVSPHTKFRVSAKKSEVLFTDYIAEHLTPDGRGDVIVPNGIVATTQNAYVKLRKFLVEDSLVAVVSLPAGIFNPYSAVKTSILFLDKKLARRIDKILFLKINADGFDLGAQRKEIPENDLPEAKRVVIDWLQQKLSEDDNTLLSWKVVAKSELLAHRACKLQTEAFLGGNVGEGQPIDVARLTEVVEINPKKSEVRGLDSELKTSFVPMEDLNDDGPFFTPSKQRKLAEVLTGYTYFRDGDVLLAKITPCFENGKAGVARNLLNGIGFGSTEFFVLRPGEKILPEFLYYLLTRSDFRVEGAARMSGAAGQQRVTRDFLDNYEIPLPPLDEQRCIVAEIESHQKVIDGARQILEALTHSLDIDSDWERVPLGTISENLDGKRRPITKSDRKPGPYPYYGASGIVDYVEGYIFDEPLLLVSEDGANLVARSTQIAFSVCGKIWVNNHAHVLRFREMATQRFVEQYLNSISISTYVTGAAQPKLNQAQLHSIPIPLPPLDEQRKMMTELDGQATQMEMVRSLIPSFETKIQRVLDRVWRNGENF